MKNNDDKRTNKGKKNIENEIERCSRSQEESCYADGHKKQTLTDGQVYETVPLVYGGSGARRAEGAGRGWRCLGMQG